MSFSKGLMLWKQLEGGLVNNPHDPGGETLTGVRKDIYMAAGGPTWPPSEEEIANYLRLHYWVRFHCEELPEPADSIFFQFVGSTERGAIQALQCVVGENPDGALGPGTLAALRAYKSEYLADSLLLAQRVRYAATHPVGDYYFHGLQKRVDRVRDARSAGEI